MDTVAERSTRLWNEDLAPATERNWGTYSLFAMWMSDVHSIGGYTFAAGLFFLGLVAWQVFIALLVGIVLVFVLHEPHGVRRPADRRAVPRRSPASPSACAAPTWPR